MRPKTMLALAGAAGGTVLATVGVVAVAGDDGSGGRASVRPAASVGSGQGVRQMASVLEKHGAGGCKVEQSRAECRFNDRYVAAQVFEGQGVTLASVLPSWKSGTAQAMTGDRGPFAILRGPNWLVTGPEDLVDSVRGDLAGRVIYCDRPYSECA